MHCGLKVLCVIAFAYAENASIISNSSIETTTETTKLNVTTTEGINVTTIATTEVTTCAANSTLCVPQNASIFNTTTERPPAVNRIWNVDKFKINSKFNCPCNLQHRFCEINCCCDSDCSPEDRATFITCNDFEDQVYDTSFCKYTKYIYINHTVYEQEVNQNGLFCIVKTNLPPQYASQTKQVIKSKNDVKVVKGQKFSWPLMNVLNIEEELFNANYSFVYGENIWILKNFSNIVPLEIPVGFLTNNCLKNKRVKFLVDSKTICSQTNINKNNVHLNIETFQNLTTILPVALNKTFKDCPKNICIPFETEICDKNYDVCKNSTKLTKFDLENNIMKCENLIHKTRYIFYHNGTIGINRAVLQLVLKNISYNVKEVIDFQQVFEVKYLWNNYTLNYSDHLSGNPGYLFGKPILIANLITYHNTTTNITTNETSTETTQKLERNHLDFAKNFMLFPKPIYGICVLTNQTNLRIEFGTNMFSKCKVKFSFRINKNSSAKHICEMVQNKIFEYWSLNYEQINNTMVNKTIGSFGNSNVHHLNDWNFILFENLPSDVLNSTNGTFIGGKILCSNITINIKIGLFYARSDENQNKIVGSFVDFDNYLQLEFNIVGDTISVGILIINEVMFYDVTTRRGKKFVDPPSFELKLPFDFFYPFIKVDNSSVAVSFSVELFILMFAILLYF